jgi:hypothetical protein
VISWFPKFAVFKWGNLYRYAESVSRWRASKGLGDGTGPASRAHTCSLGHGCAFHRIGADIFVCEATGRAHVCDDACRERVVRLYRLTTRAASAWFQPLSLKCDILV